MGLKLAEDITRPRTVASFVLLELRLAVFVRRSSGPRLPQLLNLEDPST